MALRHAVCMYICMCVYTYMYIHICTYPIIRIFVMAVDSCACSRGATKRALISGTCGVRLSGVRQDGEGRREGHGGVAEVLSCSRDRAALSRHSNQLRTSSPVAMTCVDVAVALQVCKVDPWPRSTLIPCPGL